MSTKPLPGNGRTGTPECLIDVGILGEVVGIGAGGLEESGGSVGLDLLAGRGAVFGDADCSDSGIGCGSLIETGGANS